MKLYWACAIALLVGNAAIAEAQVYPAAKEGDWVARDFRFHTGEVVPELHIHYTTVGEPSGDPVLILHGLCSWTPAGRQCLA
jgi:homoserine O-acetyltransferase